MCGGRAGGPTGVQTCVCVCVHMSGGIYADVRALRSATNRYQKFIAAAKKVILRLTTNPNLELFGKLSITFYTEMQIASYPHHPSGCSITAVCHILL